MSAHGKRKSDHGAKGPGTMVVRAGSPALGREPIKSRQFEMKPPTTPGSAPIVTREQIAEAAYYLWKKRGGNETVNWLEAEAALKNRLPKR